MPITPLPTPPNSGDPNTFNDRADALLGALPTFVNELNGLLPEIQSKGWATYGGSANTITLTAGYPALVRGIQVRFRATAANTGATTINLDGRGARGCRTITGAELPAGYIRTNADTVATYDGSIWVVDRQIERSSNANGEYMRLADGTQFCSEIVSASGVVNTTWTYPAAFSGTVDGISGNAFLGNGRVVTFAGLGSSTGITVQARDQSGNPADTATSVYLLALGRWY